MFPVHDCGRLRLPLWLVVPNPCFYIRLADIGETGEIAREIQIRIRIQEFEVAYTESVSS